MEVNGIYWDYSGLYGEKTWPDKFHMGLRLSPINIETNNAIYNSKYSTQPLKFTDTKVFIYFSI